MSGASRRPVRIPRELPELVASLRVHVELLREYARHAFDEGNDAFLGEVAGKLRLLVFEGRSNTPLLLALMDEFEMGVQITMNRPTWQEIFLEDYLESTAFGGMTSRGYVTMTYSQMIAAWGQQNGADHEDWAFEEDFARFRCAPVFVGGRHAPAAALRCVTNTVLSATDDFLGWLTPERLNTHGIASLP
jgi:hypothetical protein